MNRFGLVIALFGILFAFAILVPRVIAAPLKGAPPVNDEIQCCSEGKQK